MAERYAVKNMFAPVSERIAPPVKATRPYGWRQRFRRDQVQQGPRVLQPQAVSPPSARTGEDTPESLARDRAASKVMQPAAPVAQAPAPVVQPPAPAVRAPAPAVRTAAPTLPPLGAAPTRDTAASLAAKAAAPAVPDPRTVMDQSAEQSRLKTEALEKAEFDATPISFQSLPEWAQRKYAYRAPPGYTVPAATSALADMEAELATLPKGHPSWGPLRDRIDAEKARMASVTPATAAPATAAPTTAAPTTSAPTTAAPAPTQLTQREQAQKDLLAGYNAARYGQ